MTGDHHSDNFLFGGIQTMYFTTLMLLSKVYIVKYAKSQMNFKSCGTYVGNQRVVFSHPTTNTAT